MILLVKPEQHIEFANGVTRRYHQSITCSIIRVADKNNRIILIRPECRVTECVHNKCCKTKQSVSSVLAQVTIFKQITTAQYQICRNFRKPSPHTINCLFIHADLRMNISSAPAQFIWK
jgi:hypothetical protein